MNVTVGLRIGQRGRRADHAVAAAQVDDPLRAAALRQAAQEEAGADVEALGAEDARVVGDGPAREHAPTSAGSAYRSGQGLGIRASCGSGVQKISRAFFTASEVRVGPRIRSNSFSVEVWISVTIPVPMTTVSACTAGARRCSWSSSSARLLGTRISSTSIRSGGSVPDRQQPHRVRVDPVARQIRPGRLLAEEGVGDLYGAVRGERGDQGAPPVARRRPRCRTGPSARRRRSP